MSDEFDGASGFDSFVGPSPGPMGSGPESAVQGARRRQAMMARVAAPGKVGDCGCDAGSGPMAMIGKYPALAVGGAVLGGVVISRLLMR